ncbi:hypothetical protein PUN28_012949 [Cardiocondyla obscurior]|uniref:Ribosomal protein L20 n=1 Tax=Cardiocondyla obscurior TaxID=286306 RepID=A0AAW2FA66_9HYME
MRFLRKRLGIPVSARCVGSSAGIKAKWRSGLARDGRDRRLRTENSRRTHLKQIKNSNYFHAAI